MKWIKEKIKVMVVPYKDDIYVAKFSYGKVWSLFSKNYLEISKDGKVLYRKKSHNTWAIYNQYKNNLIDTIEKEIIY